MSVPRIKQQKDESEDEFGDLPVASDSEESEDEVGPSTTRRVRRSAKQFDAGLILTTPRIVQNSVGQIFDDLESGDIDLEPDYQRNVVWPKTKQSALIGSLLFHFYIPPILFSSRPSSNGGPSFTCIDGKQRLSSIKLFMKNEIPCKDDSQRTWWYRDDPTTGKKGIPAEMAKRFRRETIPTVIYENLTDDQEREMFQRVQMGVSLSPAEKLSALRSGWTIFCDQLTKKYMDAAKIGANLCHLVRTERSSDWLVMAQIALVILKHEQLHIPTYDGINRIVSKGDPPSEEFKRDVMEAMNRFLILANDNRWNGALRTDTRTKFSPVEFVHVGYMCWKYPTADYYELAAWTHILRTEIRQKQPGQVRFNKVCTTILKERIDSFKPQNPEVRSSRKRTRAAPEDDRDYYPEMDLGGTRSRPNAGRGRQRLSISGSYAATETEASSSTPNAGNSHATGTSASAGDSNRLFRLSPSPEASGSGRTSLSQQPSNQASEQPFFSSTWNAAAEASGSGSGAGAGAGSTNFLPHVSYMG